MSQLLPCPACNRHVDAAETACPFCAAVLPEAFRASRPLVPPPRRLGRAALMAAGATLVGAAACSSNDAIGSGPKDAAPKYDALVPVPAYGIVLPRDANFGSGGATGAGGDVATGGTGGSTDASTDAGEKARDAGQDRAPIAIYRVAPFPVGPSSSDPGKPDPQS